MLSLFKMGACASCLGYRRVSNDSDADDSTSQLLGDSQYHIQYGTAGPVGPAGPPQPDPEELKRQRDALERICAQTTDNLIDVLHPSTTALEWSRSFAAAFPDAHTHKDSRPNSSASTAVEAESQEAYLKRLGGKEQEWTRIVPSRVPLVSHL